MRLELSRIDPFRTANVGAIVYGLMLGIFALIFSPFLLFMAFLSPDETGLGPLFAVVILFLYPIMGIVMGWITGLLGSAIYNFVIRWSGGLLFDFDDVSAVTTEKKA